MAADKFAEYVEKHKRETYQPNTEGGFDCQTCDEYVAEAFYDRPAAMMVWKCSDGHVSFLKEFYL